MAKSRNPQSIMGGKAWYYEKKGSIEIIVPDDLPSNIGGVKFVRITRAKLEKSIARMPKRKKAKP